MYEYKLKYGCNPHQDKARLFMDEELPFEVINGNPGYINFMDAINSWQLVKELKMASNLPAAASFKHVSPAGVALGIPLSDTLKKVYNCEDKELSPLACAYARARGADRLSSFGDWIALSDKVDKQTAIIIRKEVSDGIIAPDYTKEALQILKEKKKGKYNIVKMEKDYNPKSVETRDVFGINFEQLRNNFIPDKKSLDNIVTENKEIPDNIKNDIILSMITLKYTQSNSVCYVKDGQVIGCGAGQQSRIHCTRLAGDKADLWYLRQHPYVLDLKFKEGIKTAEKDNAIDLYLRDDITEKELESWRTNFKIEPKKFTREEKKEWLKGLNNVVLGSDAFFPFRDNIDRAFQSGVKYVIQPGNSIRDDIIINACNEYKMAMIFSNMRLFHH
ncbi:MAG: phosphoribosylaminoimidazolecarboxamide formyltransferase [Clostridiales bacterium]